MRVRSNRYSNVALSSALSSSMSLQWTYRVKNSRHSLQDGNVAYFINLDEADVLCDHHKSGIRKNAWQVSPETVHPPVQE